MTNKSGPGGIRERKTEVTASKAVRHGLVLDEKEKTKLLIQLPMG